MLPTFKDAEGREWRFTPSLGLFDAILEATGVDLIPDGNDVSAAMALPTNRRKLSDALWAAIKSQAGEVTRAQFNDRLNGDVLTDGWGALLDAIVFFTPIQKREEVKAAIELQAAVGEQSVKAAVETMKSEETNQVIREAIEKTQREMAADLPKALGIGATN